MEKELVYADSRCRVTAGGVSGTVIEPGYIEY